ncbi:hypothetical protein SNEBB_003382, partial [Seison nebaliae]
MILSLFGVVVLLCIIIICLSIILYIVYKR